MNIEENGVSDIITPILGDSSKNAPSGIADRILFGNIEDPDEHFPTIFKVMNEDGGLIHFHDKATTSELNGPYLEDLTTRFKGYNVEIFKMLNARSK